MKIHTRMILGFAIVLGLAATIGILGLIQINSLERNLNKITQTHIIALDNVMEIDIRAKELIIGMNHFIEGNTSEEAIFLVHHNELDTLLTELATLVPDQAAAIAEVDTHHEALVTACITANTGIFDLMEDVWNLTDTLHTNYDTWMADLEQLQEGETDQAMISNATHLESYFIEQNYLWREHMMEETEDSITEFAASVAKFDICIGHLQIGSNNKTLVGIIDNWHDNVFQELITNPTTGLFVKLDAVEVQDIIVDTQAELLHDHIDELEEHISEDVDAAKAQAALAVNTAWVLITVIIVAAVGLGVTVGYFTVKSTSKMYTNMENILKAGSDASINVANMATELAASANEVNASAQEIAATTQEVSANS
ncbi:MAG: MCP four helix bundle domain-containing protein, partial [Promethearchaeota archaeon]